MRRGVTDAKDLLGVIETMLVSRIRPRAVSEIMTSSGVTDAPVMLARRCRARDARTSGVMLSAEMPELRCLAIVAVISGVVLAADMADARWRRPMSQVMSGVELAAAMAARRCR